MVVSMNKNDPVAFFDPHKGFYWAQPTKITAPVVVNVEPLALYTQRTWVGLTELEKAEITSLKWWDWEDTFDIDGFIKAIEAKLHCKNCGRKP